MYMYMYIYIYDMITVYMYILTGARMTVRFYFPHF